MSIGAALLIIDVQTAFFDKKIMTTYTVEKNFYQSSIN